MCAVPSACLWCAILGMFLCTLIGVVLPSLAEWQFFPLLFIAGIIAIVRIATHKTVRPAYYIWYACGVLVPQILFWIG